MSKREIDFKELLDYMFFRNSLPSKSSIPPKKNTISLIEKKKKQVFLIVYLMKTCKVSFRKVT
jgi:hypothetical protein